MEYKFFVLKSKIKTKPKGKEFSNEQGFLIKRTQEPMI